MQRVRIRNCTGDVFCCKKALFRVLHCKVCEILNSEVNYCIFLWNDVSLLHSGTCICAFCSLFFPFQVICALLVTLWNDIKSLELGQLLSGNSCPTWSIHNSWSHWPWLVVLKPKPLELYLKLAICSCTSCPRLLGLWLKCLSNLKVDANLYIKIQRDITMIHFSGLRVFLSYSGPFENMFGTNCRHGGWEEDTWTMIWCLQSTWYLLDITDSYMTKSL